MVIGHLPKGKFMKTNENENENGVSPVIGVILMVAITVILAAVIAAFVFGMSGQINKTKIVAVTVQQPQTNQIVVLYQGGQDAQSFDHGIVEVTNDNPADPAVVYDNGDGTDNSSFGNKVGSQVTATGIFLGKNHVVVVGHFTDGTEQVLSDTYV